MPPSNWMNDPNGLIHWQGHYHMFYQYNPGAAHWGDIHWGHAESPDMVHWTHRPIALAPQPGGPDAGGCWSGCAVPVGEKAAFLYTGVIAQSGQDYSQSVCLAWGQDNLEALQRDAKNPVIPAPPPGIRAIGFRDPSVWQQGNEWRLALGSGVEGEGPLALLYASRDLRSWEYLGPLCRGTDAPPTSLVLGKMWECPSVFFDAGQAGLLVSAWEPGIGHGPLVLTGHFNDPHFTPRWVEKLDHGGAAFYAPQTFRDAAGRVLMFAWLQEARSQEEQDSAGWSGVMSLPRRVWIDPAGQPRYAFAPELESLRGEHISLRGEHFGAGRRALPLAGAQVEIVMELERASAQRTGLCLLCAPDGSEETRLVFDWRQNLLILERKKSRRGGPFLGNLTAPLPREDVFSLHLYLDASTIECILNERVALSGRVYPTMPDCRGLALFADEGKGLIRRLDLYQLRSAW